MPMEAADLDIASIVWRGGPGQIPDDAASENLPADSLLAAVAAVAAKAPDRVAVASERQTVSFAALIERATALGLRIAGSPPGPAGVLLPHGAGLVVAILACAAAGRVALLLNHEAPPLLVRRMLGEGGASAVIVHANDSVHRASIFGDIVQIDPATEHSLRAATLPPPTEPEAPAIVLFTSGSTGQPKGIVRSSRLLLEHAAREQSQGKFRNADVVLSLADPCTGSGLSCIVAGLALGMTQIAASIAQLGATGLVRLAAREGVTALTGAPGPLRLLLQRRRADAAFGGLERVIVKGDAMLAADLAALRARTPPSCRIWYGYGLTETSAIAGWFIPREHTDDEARVPSGRPLDGVRYALLDEDGRAVSDDRPGELWISSRRLMVGEWRDGRVETAKLPPDPARAGHSVFRTGDIARIDDAGLMRVIGRRDRQVKINGVRIDPAEAENVLRGAPGVADAAVIFETGEGGSFLVAHVVVGPGTSLADRAACDDLLADLRSRLQSALPTSLRPSRIALTDRLPRLGAGKVNALALAAAPV